MEYYNDDPKVASLMGKYEKFKKLLDLSPTAKAVLIVLIVIGFIVSLLPYLVLSSLFNSTMSERSSKGCTENVTAEVTSLTEYSYPEDSHIKNKDDLSSDPSYAPVFTYEFDGKTYNVQSRVYSQTPKYNVGEKVALKIDPSDPEHFYDPKQSKNISLYGVLLVFPIMYAAFILSLYLKLKKIKSKINSISYDNGRINVDDTPEDDSKIKIKFKAH